MADGSSTRGAPARTRGWTRRAGAGLALALALLGGAGLAGAGGGPGEKGRGPWAGETTLSPEERRELEERRAALTARAEDLAARLSLCGDLRALVREDLARVQHVHAVEVGLVLLTSNPPRMPVTFAIALSSGRVVWDRLTVTVPVRARVLPLDGLAGDHAMPACIPPRR